jgi:NADH:ubiquinone oxidoreductase subunit 5 (subunit L)/multisubunit Na+/H+ antiporter MnhA subunit
MEAPIPASSLIHSATLVSAGIYLCYRFSPQIQMYFPYFVILSSFTAAYGAVIAACQTDLKKILAYSTISHCGYLFVLVFIGNTNLLLTYLHIHGVFKAFSFMLVGFILQNNSIYQDYRSIGYLFKKTSYEYYTLPFILFNLAGLPFFLGFFSKFLFLESFKLQWVGVLNILFVKLGAFCSILYSFQLYYNVFFAPNRSSNIPTTTNILTKNQNFIYKILSSFILIFITTITLFIFSLEFVGFAFSTQSVFFLKFFYKLLFLVFLVFFKNFNHTSLFIILVVVFYVLF